MQNAVASRAAISPPATSLNVGIHWPSMLSEGDNIANLLEAATFFTMEQRADDVGETGIYALLLAMICKRQGEKFRINLLGHSFGCKVICSALERLAIECPTNVQLDSIQFNIVLLQAAFDNNDFESSELYGDISNVNLIPNLRILLSTSQLDAALTEAFPLAHRLEFFNRQISKVAMGAVGPTSNTMQLFGGCDQISVNPGVDFTQRIPFAQRLVCADLTPLHAANSTFLGGVAGHHTDIYHPEIYSLIARFLY